MEMEFVRHEPCYDRILFVLTLDRKKMKERILIGEELQVRFRLEAASLRAGRRGISENKV